MDIYSSLGRRINLDGGSLFYIDEGQGTPLVFIHGIWGSMRNWIPNIEFFKNRCRVIALDLPACGDSSIFDADYSSDFFTETILSFLARIGVEKFIPVGHSLGGLITLNIALSHPELIEAIILVDAAGGHNFPLLTKWGVQNLPERLLKKIVFGLSSYLLRVPLTRKMAAGVYTENKYTDALIEFQLSFARKPNLDEYLDAYLKTARTAVLVSYESALGDITEPTLIVWGEKDATLPPAAGLNLCRKIRGSYLSIVPRAAHCPQIEQPEIFNSVVLRFLKGIGAL